MSWRGVSNQQWEKIKDHLPKRKKNLKGGRPVITDRQCFEGILWVLWTGAPWSEVPKQFGSGSTCWRRLQQWERSGVLLNLWREFLSQLSDRKKVKWDECFADGTFAPAKKGVYSSARPRGEREQSLWFWSMARVLRSEFTWIRHHQRK
jgi:transposase